MWPAALAPYAGAPGGPPRAGRQRRRGAAPRPRSSTSQLQRAGVDVLYDDRDASPGIKFADADLLGLPVRLTLGAKGLARGIVERRVRATGVDDELALDGAAAALRA